MTEQEAYEMYERWMWLGQALATRGRYKLASIHFNEAADISRDYGWSDRRLFAIKASVYALLGILPGGDSHEQIA